MDSKKLHANILGHLASDPMAQKHLGDTSDLRWMQTDDGFLCHNGQIYIPEAKSLRLRVLQYKHDHILSEQDPSPDLPRIHLAQTSVFSHQVLQVLYDLYAV
jgi:hypothetical protein